MWTMSCRWGLLVRLVRGLSVCYSIGESRGKQRLSAVAHMRSCVCGAPLPLSSQVPCCGPAVPAAPKFEHIGQSSGGRA